MIILPSSSFSECSEPENFFCVFIYEVLDPSPSFLNVTVRLEGCGSLVNDHCGAVKVSSNLLLMRALSILSVLEERLLFLRPASIIRDCREHG